MVVNFYSVLLGEVNGNSRVKPDENGMLTHKSVRNMEKHTITSQDAVTLQ